MKRRGWSIVEFMIAVALGLLVTWMASGMLLASTSNYRHHSESLVLADSGRYALHIMAEAIRQGAYVNWDDQRAPVVLTPDATASIDGRDAASVSRASEGISGLLPAVVHGSDVLALRFSGIGDGSILNCGGFNEAAPTSADTRAWSIFYVAADANGEPELRCKYRGAAGWGADAIVRGVDSFQVLYGVDTDTPADGIANTWLNATAVGTANQWKRVCSVRMGLLLHGDGNSRSDTVNMRYDLFGAAYSDAHGEDAGVRLMDADFPEPQRHRPRRVFSMTVALRNRDG